MFLPLSPEVEVREWLGFQQESDTSWHEDVSKNRHPCLFELHERANVHHHSGYEEALAQKWTSIVPFDNWRKEKERSWAIQRTISENDRGEKDNIKICVGLFHLLTAYSLSLSRSGDPFHTLFLSFRGLLGRAVANKLLHLVNKKTVYCVFVTSSKSEVTTRSS